MRTRIFSKQLEHALCALTHLAQPPHLCDAHHLSQSEQLPHHFIAKILQELHKKGFLKSKRGIEGGYELARPPGEMKLIDVFLAINGDRFLRDCPWRLGECSETDPCWLHETWTTARERMESYLRDHTVADLAKEAIRHSQGREREEEILRGNRELSTVNAVGDMVIPSPDLDETLCRILEKVLEVTGADAGEIFLWEEATQKLVMRAFRGLAAQAFHEITQFNLNTGLPGWIARTQEPLVVHHLAREPRFLRKKVIEAGFHFFAGVPLKSEGKLVGVMDIATRDPMRLGPEVVQLLAVFGNQIGAAKTLIMFVNEFSKIFRDEHRQIRDKLRDLIEAFAKRDQVRIQPLLQQLAALTGPHFRYEEEELYPALTEILPADYIESLLSAHDRAIGTAKELMALATQGSLSADEASHAAHLIQRILPHVSDCDGLSIMVECLREEKIKSILDARERANQAGLDLLQWAEEVRKRRPTA